MYHLTKQGKAKVQAFIAECQAKRKEILDAGKDTADETTIPTEEDVISDVNWQGLDEENEYINGWGVTDNHDLAIRLRLGEELEEAK